MLVEVGEEQPELSARLARLAENYDYQLMLDLLEHMPIEAAKP